MEELELVFFSSFTAGWYFFGTGLVCYVHSMVFSSFALLVVECDIFDVSPDSDPESATRWRRGWLVARNPNGGYPQLKRA